MTNLVKDKNQPQSMRVAERLKEMILNNDLPPGANLLETELGEMLGVSRTPVREAAVILEAHGLVEIQPRRGIRVVPLTIRDMEDIYDILTELEPLAAATAARMNLDQAALEGIEECLTEMEDALENEDRRRWADWDGLFHQRLVALSGNSRLMSVVEMFSDQVHRARILTLQMRPLPTSSNANHRDLLDAIRRGDADGARQIHREHRVSARHMLVDLLEKHGLVRF